MTSIIYHSVVTPIFEHEAMYSLEFLGNPLGTHSPLLSIYSVAIISDRCYNQGAFTDQTMYSLEFLGNPLGTHSPLLSIYSAAIISDRWYNQGVFTDHQELAPDHLNTE
jgi:hypothetical protein